MKNFLKLADNVNVLPIMIELQRNVDLWNENTLRTKHPGTAHAEVSDIWVWFNDTSPLMLRTVEGKEYQDGSRIINDKEVIPYRAWKDLPSIKPLILALMNQVGAIRLGRVIITKLPPGKTITPHVDGGAPATYYQRYQIALQCLPGNKFIIGDEEVGFKTGEVWQINNRETHSVVNNSADDRIVMIADMRSE
jgi:hypothetical protein